MPNSTQYRLLRTGSVRGGAVHRSRGGRSGRYGANTDILAPKIEEFGHQPFTEVHLNALALQLQSPSWPRGALNIYGLEGLLTALLVLPLGLRAGTWVPFIWNETGWKIPVALQGSDEYRHFMNSTIAFMRTIDSGFCSSSPTFTSTLHALDVQHRPKSLNPYQDWALGFGLAVSQSNYLRSIPDPMAHRALYAIGAHANPPATLQRPLEHSCTRKLQQAVLALATTRSSRGPLGP